MTAIFYTYLAFILFLGFLSFRRVKSYKDFTLAGANQGYVGISLSLLAGMIGGTATFGMVSLVEKNGFPAFWWLGSGAFFLFLQALFLAKPVRSLNAYSLPHLARLVISPKASFYIASIICITWIGIVAAQFIALGQLISVISPEQDPKIIIAVVGLFVIAYTVLGGQFSILKTDAYQFSILFCTLLAIFGLMYATNYFSSQGEISSTFQFLSMAEITDSLSSRFALFSDEFRPYNLLFIFFVGGLAYFVGPDIFSRNLSAKNVKVAQVSTFVSSFILLCFAFLISFIADFSLDLGMQGNENALVSLIKDYLPTPLAILLALGLVSALISSADTCLLSTATIVSHDILQSKSVRTVRLLTLVIGLVALVLALFKSNIIGLLFASYSVYVPGVVIPLACALLCHNKKQINLNVLLIAIIGGSALGLVSNFTKIQELTLLGIAFSGVCSLLSLYVQKFSLAPSRKESIQSEQK